MKDHRNADRPHTGACLGTRQADRAKPPLRPKHVWSIRTKLQIEGGRATWQCSIWPSIANCVAAMSSPQGRDVVPSGYAVDRPRSTEEDRSARQVRVDGANRQAVDDYLRAATKKPGEFMFTGRRFGKEHHDETVCAARLRVDCMHRPRPTPFRHPLTTTD